MSRIIKTSAALLMILFSQVLIAQDYKVSDKTSVKIIGTSNVHDWEETVGKVIGKGTFKIEDNKVKAIDYLLVQFVVKSIESGKGKMNSYTYEALKEEEHPNIQFKLLKVNEINNDMVEAQATINIAGVSKKVIIVGKATSSGDTVSISGNFEIDMTEYNVEPPTALLGTIKVEKMVTIEYNIVLVK
jgi:polyisoprenoid-binding protein YceI